MSLQNPSKEKLLKNSVASFVEAHPDASMHNIAVLFTDVVGSTKYFKAHGDIKGREMLRRHHRIALSIVEDYGGSLIKEVGDSVMVYFPDALNALKASIKMQHQFNSHNNSSDLHNQIRIRVGIHYGKVIVEEKDIYGDVVNVAAKLTNLANGDQIFISKELYELTKDVSSAKFELVNFWNMKNVPTGLTIYRVIWEHSPVAEAERMAVLHLRLKKESSGNGQNHFRRIWESFISNKEVLLANRHESEYALSAEALALSFKDSSNALDVAEHLLEYLNAELQKTGSTNKASLHMVITKDTDAKRNLLPMQKAKIDPEAFEPGEIYVSKNIYDDVKKTRDVSLFPPPIEHYGKAFYKYVKGNSVEPEAQQTLDVESGMAKGIFETCFYCGSNGHPIKDCPSKNVTENTRSLSEAGYLSTDKLKMLLSLYLGAQDAPQNATAVLRANAYGEQELIMNCLYEVKKIYQLQFFRTIWESNADLWEKAKKNISVSEGGFAWLALDSFRVSNYGRTETYLKTAIENNAKDYKPYCILGFLNIERDRLIEALKNFESALALSRTIPQRIFIYFLQSRVYILLGNIQKAQERINKILALDSACIEAVYEDIKLKLRQEREGSVTQRLQKLIIENRKYYVIATIDPEMKPHSKIVSNILGQILTEAKTEALSLSKEASHIAENANVTLTKKNAEDVRSTLSRISELIASDSYFGYLDAGQLGSSVISVCNNALREQKKSLSETIFRINKRLEQHLDYVRQYRYPRLSNVCLGKLKLIKSSLAQIGSVNMYSAAEQFEASNLLCGKIIQELSSIEMMIKKLEIYQQTINTSLRFLKHSSILFSIVFFIGIFIFPFLEGSLNNMLVQLNISSVQNAWSFQKIFLISGGILSLIVAFLITARKSFE